MADSATEFLRLSLTNGGGGEGDNDELRLLKFGFLKGLGDLYLEPPGLLWIFRTTGSSDLQSALSTFESSCIEISSSSCIDFCNLEDEEGDLHCASVDEFDLLFFLLHLLDLGDLSEPFGDVEYLRVMLLSSGELERFLEFEHRGDFDLRDDL